MTAQERVERATGALKVFPLPSAVLFPHTVIPLHIFEPRYRELVRDALATDRVLALGQLESGWEGSYEGRPPLQSMLCAGVIVWDEQVEDGRYNILLQGVSRVRLVEELPADKLYRQVRAQALPDLPYTGPEEEQLRQAVFELAGRVPPSFAENLLPVAARAGGGMLADVVASAVVPDPERRQELLGALDVRRRLELVLEDLSDLLGQLQPVRPSGPLN
ncbi:ATP-dependent protease [Corallococcus praedator]|uniref:ATP-dependent protease n=1 Tax=Corallococcus praedator TaxID=2316724 RepID=A0ABX9Q3E4_9BACT|nr:MULTISPECIES: LON peptidase substrate-binding domain-containing protein [Corallococcus]RKG98231.1 ATP-dependent protease [Corallococcus sp. CA047B]RKH17787.1 ATP-dependent protease [Corallococcus sp. CA031C]RKH88243.1 ATP-dependent protease [Corallococcus praedator]